MALKIRGVWEDWWGDLEVTSKLREKDIDNFISRANGPIALKDRDHTVLNAAVLVPILKRMRSQSCLKVPSKPDLEEQVKVLHCRILGYLNVDEDSLDKFCFTPESESHIYCAVTGIKRMVCFARKAFLRSSCPREPSAKFQVSNTPKVI